MKILIAENSEQFAKRIKVLLTSNGYLVNVVDDGKKALEEVLNNKYNALLLNAKISKLTGIEITREIRKRNINISILMISERRNVTEIVEGLNAGADDYMTQPFYEEELLVRVRNLLRR